MHQPRSLLAIDAAPFGQSLDLLPCLAAIRRAYPKSHISAAVSDATSQLLLNYGLANYAYGLGIIKPSDHGFGSAAVCFQRLSRLPGGLSFEMILDFSPRVATQVFSWVKRGRLVAPSLLPGFADPLFGLGRGKRPMGRAAYDSVLKQLGLDQDGSWWRIPLKREDSRRFEDHLAHSGFIGGELIVLVYSAEADWPGGWPTGSFVDLAWRLSKNFGVRIVFVDAPGTSGFTNKVMPWSSKDPIRLHNPQAVDVIAALARASLVITDDGGLARAARGLGTPALNVSNIQESREDYEAPSGSVSVDEACQHALRLLKSSRTSALFEL